MREQEQRFLNPSEIPKSPEYELLNRLIIITGVSACGKDFLLDRIKQKPLSTIKRFNFGTLLAEEIGCNRDEIRQQSSLNQITNLQMKIAKKVLDNLPAILTSHVVSSQNGLLITNPKLEFELKPSCYVIIIADPKLIIEWRRQRNTKTRRVSEIENPQSISFHQKQIIFTVLNYAHILGSHVLILNNNPSKTTENTNTLVNLISQL